MRISNKDFHGNEVKRNCKTCEFNEGVHCMGHSIRTDNGKDTYGLFIYETSKMFPNGCDDYEISFQDFCGF
jgi:hypothetical protein